MAGKITDLTAIGSIDRANDLLEIVDVSLNQSYNVTPNNLFGITGGVVMSTTDTETMQNKTVDNTNTITVKAGNFTLQDGSDTTKQAKFVLSGITTGNTRSFTLPDTTDTIVVLAATQTLTNKTLTSPVITGGSIDQTTITVDAIAGHTTANTGTIYGVQVTAGVLSTAGTVNGSALVNSTVTPSKLNTGAQAAYVATQEARTNASYAALTTASSVTVSIGANGLALVVISANILDNTNGGAGFMSFALCGANTQAASDIYAISLLATGVDVPGITVGASFLLTGLTSGSTVFTTQFRSAGADTAYFTYRRIAVIPL